MSAFSSQSGSGSAGAAGFSCPGSGSSSGSDDSCSVANLLKQLGIDENPGTVFHDPTELPDWLVDVPEHNLFPVEAAVAAAAIAAAGRPHLLTGDIRNTHWMKVSSAYEFHQQLASSSLALERDLLREPLFIYLMPTTPLVDARAIFDMGRGLERLPVSAEMVIHNQADCNNKVAAYNAAEDLRAEIDATRVAVEDSRLNLDAVMEANRKRTAELAAVYHQQKLRYLGATGDGGGNIANSKHFYHGMMLTASARIVVAQQAADRLQEASAYLASLAESLTKKVSELDEAMVRPTFMGCGGDGAGACDLGMASSASSS